MNVMKKAWEIAKQGQANFGGKVKEYFAASLKTAWALAKKAANTVEITLREGSRNNKTWVAEIVGLDGKWGFNRRFVDCRQHPEYCEKLATLENGKVYEICNGGDRDFARVVNGEINYIWADDAKALFA